MFMDSVEGFGGLVIYGMVGVVVGTAMYVVLDSFGNRVFDAVRGRVGV